ncbi:hypothetical protein ACIGO9_30175 [Nocardia asteroides]|uniref:hypothetical protein n=1 Tax=Nocardia asteroides TaxID=1824 RepID=UPI0037CBF654
MADSPTSAAVCDLAIVYAPELAVLATRAGVSAEIVDTGGGVLAIEADLGVMAGSRGRWMRLSVSTADDGLATGRAGILHWQVQLYDAEIGGDEVALGHDRASFTLALAQAMADLAAGIAPPVGACACTGHGADGAQAAVRALGASATAVVSPGPVPPPASGPAAQAALEV